MMWPALLDYSVEDCRRILRRLELEAYASIISVFRAQGALTKEKKSILQELSSSLSISLERHRAEIRRAVNDEKLNTIADRMYGPNTGSDWAVEGRRLVPLIPRLAPQTAFTAIANDVASKQAAKNASMLPPCSTSLPEASLANNFPSSYPIIKSETSSFESHHRAPAFDHSISADNSFILPSNGNAKDTHDEELTKKRKRSSSIDLPSSPPKFASTFGSFVEPGISNNAIENSSKVATSSSNLKNIPGTPSNYTPKVILVSTTSTNSTAAKSLNVPLVKTVSTNPTTVTVTQSKPLLSTSSSAISTEGNTSLLTPTTVSSQEASTSNPMSMLICQRPKNLPLGASKQTPVRPRANVSPSASYQAHAASPTCNPPCLPPSSSSGHPLHVRPASPASRTTNQTRHEGGVKIVTQNIPTTNSKAIQKPTITVTLPTTTMTVRLATTTNAPSSGKVINVLSASPHQNLKVFTRPMSVTAVGGQHSQAQTVKVASFVNTSSGNIIRAATPGAKPNVIVVQKAQVWPSFDNSGATMLLSSPSSVVKLNNEGNLQEAVTFVQRPEVNRPNTSAPKTFPTALTSGMPSLSNPLAPSPLSGGSIEPSQYLKELKAQEKMFKAQVKEKKDEQKSNLLADLIQAAGILQESTAPPNLAMIPSSTTSSKTSKLKHFSKIEEKSPMQVEANINLEEDKDSTTSGENSETEKNVSFFPQSSFQIPKLELATLKPDSKNEDSHGKQSNARPSSPDIPLLMAEASTDNQKSSDGNIKPLDTSEEKSSDSNEDKSDDAWVDSKLQAPNIEDSNEDISEIEAYDKGEENRKKKSDESQKIFISESHNLQPKPFIIRKMEHETKQEKKTSEIKSTVKSSVDICKSKESKPEDDLVKTVLVEPSLNPSILNLEDFTSQKVDVNIQSEPPQEVVEPKNLKDDKNIENEAEESAKLTLKSAIDELSLTELEESVKTKTISKTEIDTSVKEAKDSVEKKETPCKSKEDKELVPKLTDLENESKVKESIAKDASEENMSEELQTDLPKDDEMLTVDPSLEQVIFEELQKQSGFSSEPSISEFEKVFGEELPETEIDVNKADQTEVQKDDSKETEIDICFDKSDTASVKSDASSYKEVSVENSDSVSVKTEDSNVSDTREAENVESMSSAGKSLSMPRRKRKPTTVAESANVSHHLTGWARIASGLLDRVCKYKVSGHPKGEPLPSNWFLYPVNADEVPDYYEIVQNPMDFSKVREKLQNGSYKDISQFHADMMLIKENCELYNPETHAARQDCNEVYTYYLREYNRLVEKWTKTHLLASPKRMKLS